LKGVVVYHSIWGSCQEIAEAIAGGLKESGQEVQVLAVEEAGKPESVKNLSPYPSLHNNRFTMLSARSRSQEFDFESRSQTTLEFEVLSVPALEGATREPCLFHKRQDGAPRHWDVVLNEQVEIICVDGSLPEWLFEHVF